MTRATPSERSVPTFLAVLVALVVGAVALVQYVRNGTVRCGAGNVPIHRESLPSNPYCKPFVEAGQSQELGIYIAYLAVAILVLTFAARSWLRAVTPALETARHRDGHPSEGSGSRTAPN